jgi:hypothetical protein
MGKGDISKEPYDDIISLCLRSSRGSSRNRTQARDASSRIHKSTNGGVTREEMVIYLKTSRPISLAL